MSEANQPPTTPTPPAGPPPTGATPPSATPPTGGGSGKQRSAGVSLAALIWIGAGIVVLSFVASFLGASVARNADAAATPTPTATEELDEAAYEEAIKEILPAGSAVRAGTGVPEAGKGYEGDVYIDIATSDVYLFREGEWTLVGNIRANAAENLTGATGATGETGAQGEAGASGAPGAPGTQVTLGLGAPEAETCVTDGDVYIDTEVAAFYQCAAGEWVLFGPPSTSTPEPTDGPDDSNG